MLKTKLAKSDVEISTSRRYKVINIDDYIGSNLFDNIEPPLTQYDNLIDENVGSYGVSNLIESLQDVEILILVAKTEGRASLDIFKTIAEIAIYLNILTIGIITIPIVYQNYENKEGISLAIDELRVCVNSLIVLPELRVLSSLIADEDFSVSSYTVSSSLELILSSVTDIFEHPGMIFIEAEDIRATMPENGLAKVAISKASGTNRAQKAVNDVFSNLLKGGVRLKGVKGVIVNLASAPNMLRMEEYHQIIRGISEYLSEDTCLKVGMTEVVGMADDEVCLTLITTGVNISSRNIVNEVWVNILFSFVREDNYAALNALIEKGADVNLNDGMQNLLTIAVEYGEDIIVQLLIKNGAKVNALIENAYEYSSALMLAAARGKDSMVKLLIENGADVNLLDSYGSTALIYALDSPVLESNCTEISCLAEKDVKIDTKLDDLIAKYDIDNYNILKLLIENGAEPNLQDNRGRTALMCACERGCANEVKYLLERGADINTIDNLGHNALMYALAANKRIDNSAVAQLLIAYGIALNVQDHYGRTALIFAAEYGDAMVLKKCIKQGADISILDNKGCNALVYAAKNRHYAALKVLCANKK